jgi:hypothetical protein
MNLHEINVTQEQAKAALEEYRESVRDAFQYEVDEALSRAERRRVELEAADKQIMEGYRALANGRQVISLRATLVAGGEDKEHRPMLAVCRADEPQIEMTRWPAGRVRYDPQPRRDSHGWATEGHPASGQTSRRFDFLGLLPEKEFKSRWGYIEAFAVAPHIPPHLRPKTLDRYTLLWEADWQQKQPVDPALLRPVGGDLYVVVATWDLTELERAVLNAR